MTTLAFERHPVDPKHSEAFEDLLNVLLEQIRAAPGIMWADAARAFDDPPSYILLAEWRTEADAGAWGASAQAGAFRDTAEPLLRAETTRRLFVSAP